MPFIHEVGPKPVSTREYLEALGRVVYAAAPVEAEGQEGAGLPEHDFAAHLGAIEYVERSAEQAVGMLRGRVDRWRGTVVLGFVVNGVFGYPKDRAGSSESPLPPDILHTPDADYSYYTI